MEWQQIIGFYHAARLGSFTKAGEVTFRTQSALSQQMKALEDELGCQVFERVGRRKLKLTPAGEKFMSFAESVMERYEHLRDELEELEGAQRGALKLAAPFTTLYHLFPERLKEYSGQFPEVELTLFDRPQGKVLELVRDGEVDFGFALDSLIPSDLAATRWKKVEKVLLVPRGHELVALEPVTWEQLARYPLILPPKSARHSGRAYLEDKLKALGIEYRVVMESSNVELSSVYVEIGLGVSFATIVPDLPSLKERRLDLIPLDHYFEPDYISAVTRKGKVLASYKNAFLDILLDEEQGP
jgi:DNA-binding transcriptional LysR family regulator